MQEVKGNLKLRRVLFILFLCAMGVLFFARAWTPFWVDISVGILAAGIAAWEVGRKDQPPADDESKGPSSN